MKKKLQNLVELSYINGKLDQEVVKTIADRLTRHELKQYITLLKREENTKQVFVTTPEELNKEDRKKLESLFPNKKVNYSIDPSMISGIKVVEEDEEYEINLNRTFNDIIQFLGKND